MRTSQLINMILMAVPSVTRVKALECVNYAIGFIVDRPLAFNIYKDETTGADPVLTTTAGVYKYTLNSATIGVDVEYVGGVTDTADDFSTQIVYSSLYDQTNGCAVITFKEDPGGSDYFVRAYKKPTTLTSESSNGGIVPFPEQFTLHLMDLVIGMLERLFHGKSDRYDRCVAELIPEVRGQVNDVVENIVYTSERYY